MTIKQILKDFVDTFFGFRKILAFFSLFIVAVVFRISNHIDGAQFVDLMKAVTVSFFASNSCEHFTLMAKDYFNSKKDSDAREK